MKFHKTLEKGQVNVWKDFYIPYNELKNTIKNNKGRFENEILLSLAKIDGFYLKVEGLILEEKNKMIKRMRRKNDDSKSKSGSNESSKKTESPPVGRTKNGEGKILERKEIEGAIKNADSNIGRALSDLDSEINVKAQEIRNTVLEDTSTERNSDSAVEYKVTSDKIEGDGSKNKEGKKGSTSKVKKDGKDKKSDKKKLIRSFDDNSITKKQKQIKSSTKFSVFNLFKFKDKYSHRQKEKNITKLIEVCESMKKYASLNFTGFRKIIKKYDKFHDAKMTDVLMPIVKKSYFYRSKRVEHATDELKSLYKTHFAGNDKRKAKNVFQNIAKREKSSQMSSFFSGSFLSLSIFIYYSIEFQKDDMLRSIFTGFNMIFYGFLLFGLCIIVFKKYYINYAFIFDFDITTQESIGTYFFIVSTFCLVHNLGFFLVKRYSVTTQTVAVYVNLILLTFPFGVFYKNTRYFFIYALTKMLTTPFFSVQFRHFYIADCLQSFTYAYKLIFLYYINNSKSKILLAICLTPCLIRIMQCYKRSCEESNMKVHMLNTLKYTLAILFIISCYLYNLHENDYTLSSKLFFGVASSFYSLYWDLVRDWEIRRKVRIYNITFLLFIALYNCICRFAWVVTHYQSQFEMVVALMEVHRRFLWTLLRVECEHLNNRDSLKAICGFTGKLSDMFFKAEDELESGISEDEKIDDTIVI